MLFGEPVINNYRFSDPGSTSMSGCMGRLSDGLTPQEMDSHDLTPDVISFANAITACEKSCCLASPDVCPHFCFFVFSFTE